VRWLSCTATCAATPEELSSWCDDLWSSPFSSRHGSDLSSPGRLSCVVPSGGGEPISTATRSARSRRAAKTIASAEGASTHCRSSTRTRRGTRSALAGEQAQHGSPENQPAGRRLLSLAPSPTHAAGCPSRRPTGRAVGRRARAAPGSPTSTSTPPRPERAAPNIDVIRASLASRPTITAVTVGLIERGCRGYPWREHLPSRGIVGSSAHRPRRTTMRIDNK